MYSTFPEHVLEAHQQHAHIDTLPPDGFEKLLELEYFSTHVLELLPRDDDYIPLSVPT